MLFGSRKKLKIAVAADLGDANQSSPAVGDLARRYFDQGYNCAQSVLLSTADMLGVDVPLAMVKGAASFTGGVGKSGCICGALVGASLILGVISVSDTKPQKGKKALDLTGQFHDIFKANFRSTCCRVLRKDRTFKDKDADLRCKELTARTAELLIDMLNEVHGTRNT
ncbi:MAG TPA: C-GCAxxG-C-C family protein [Candidatus Aquicultor sp.]